MTHVAARALAEVGRFDDAVAILQRDLAAAEGAHPYRGGPPSDAAAAPLLELLPASPIPGSRACRCFFVWNGSILSGAQFPTTA